jgi:hypothetical protein
MSFSCAAGCFFRFISFRCIARTEEREKNHLADGLRIRKQHNEPVDTNSLSSRRRQSMTQSANVIHIHFLRSFAAAFVDLRLKTPFLVRRVV